MNQQYQQPQSQVQMPSAGAVLGGISDKIAAALPVFVTILVILAVISCVYYLIYGLVTSIQAESFRVFLNAFTTAIFRAMEYFFFAGVLAGINKLIKK